MFIINRWNDIWHDLTQSWRKVYSLTALIRRTLVRNPRWLGFPPRYMPHHTNLSLPWMKYLQCISYISSLLAAREILAWRRGDYVKEILIHIVQPYLTFSTVVEQHSCTSEIERSGYEKRWNFQGQFCIFSCLWVVVVLFEITRYSPWIV